MLVMSTHNFFNLHKVSTTHLELAPVTRRAGLRHREPPQRRVVLVDVEAGVAGEEDVVHEPAPGRAAHAGEAHARLVALLDGAAVFSCHLGKDAAAGGQLNTLKNVTKIITKVILLWSLRMRP